MHSVNKPRSKIMRESFNTLTHAILSMPRLINATPAVFIDRDGTLNIDKGYLTNVEDVELLPAVGESILRLNQRNIPVVIVTNQSAFARGLIDFAGFEAVNAAIWRELQQYQSHYDALYYCPHLSDCECRKPQPGLLLQAAADLNLDLGRSYMIGDKPTDILAGKRAGCRTLYVRNDTNESAVKQLRTDDCSPDHVSEDLLDAVNRILSQMLH